MSDNTSLFYNNFNGTFFLSLGTLTITAVSVCLGFALKSKCKNVKLCFGCLEIERDVELEADVEMAQPPAVPPVDTMPTTVATRRRSYNLTEVSRTPPPETELDHNTTTINNTI